ncbi:MAG: hypothetical protein ACK5W9_13370 [Bdellovibrionales bacterium]
MIRRVFILSFTLIVGGNIKAREISADAIAVQKKLETCICQIGSEPSYQIPIFKLGCALWLTQQTNCHSKKILSEKNSLINFVEINENLSLGFVGHWGSSEQLALFLEKKVLPVALKKKLNRVRLDNTACSAMDNPEVVKNWLTQTQTQYPEIHFRIRGNQLKSIGMWAPLTNVKTNVPAVVSSSYRYTLFPLCKNFEGSSCSRMHDFQVVHCEESKKTVKRLKCISNSNSFSWTDDGPAIIDSEEREKASQ